MKLLELFCGTKSISTVAEHMGFETITVDKDAKFDPTISADLLEISDDYFNDFDVVWASPPCQTYSMGASRGGHRYKGEHGWNLPITEFAHISDELVRKTIRIIENVRPTFWFIENPRGGLRHTPMMMGIKRITVWYCQYGDIRAKPTDIFYNKLPKGFEVRVCKNHKFDDNGNIIDRACHHEPARRGSKTGTQGLKNPMERGRVPQKFCKELLEQIVKEIRRNK